MNSKVDIEELKFHIQEYELASKQICSSSLEEPRQSEFASYRQQYHYDEIQKLLNIKNASIMNLARKMASEKVKISITRILNSKIDKG